MSQTKKDPLFEVLPGSGPPQPDSRRLGTFVLNLLVLVFYLIVGVAALTAAVIAGKAVLMAAILLIEAIGIVQLAAQFRMPVGKTSESAALPVRRDEGG